MISLACPCAYIYILCPSAAGQRQKSFVKLIVLCCRRFYDPNLAKAKKECKTIEKKAKTRRRHSAGGCRLATGNQSKA